MKQIFQDTKLQEEVERYGRYRHLEGDTTIIQPDDEMVFIPIVLKGAIRIMRQNAEGSEVYLYHLYPGQTCAMALNCCATGRRSMIRAVTEDVTDIIQIPVHLMEEWSRYAEWRKYMQDTYLSRLTEMLTVIDLIAFNHMDSQLMHYLRERSRALSTNALYITHQEIAEELHTHREAISRLLRTMEDKKLVKLGRHTIELL